MADLAERPAAAVRTLGELALSAADRHSGDAMRAPGRAPITYADFGRAIREIAGGLASLGINQGDKVAILAGTAITLGFAVLGWGGIATFFSHPARTALVLVTIVLAAVAFFAGGSLSAGEREDRGNRWVIAAFAVIGLAMAYLPACTDRAGFWTVDGDVVRWLGVVLFAIGGALRLWPVFVLGHRFSGLVAIQPGHTLVTTGIYRIVRHPSYLGLVVNAVGWALAFRSGIGLLLVASMLVPLVARMRAEEALLRTQFGRAYEAYCARTARLVPGVY